MSNFSKDYRSWINSSNMTENTKHLIIEQAAKDQNRTCSNSTLLAKPLRHRASTHRNGYIAAAFIGVLVLSGLTFTTNILSQNTFSPIPANSFELIISSAYADDESIPIQDDNSEHQIQWSGISFGDSSFTCSYTINLACSGNNVNSYDYSIENDRSPENANTLENVCFHSKNSDYLTEGPSPSDSFSVDTHNNTEKDIVRTLVVQCPISDEHSTMKNAVDSGDIELNQFIANAVLSNAKALSAARIKITANFQDGTSNTKTYQLIMTSTFPDELTSILDNGSSNNSPKDLSFLVHEI